MESEVRGTGNGMKLQKQKKIQFKKEKGAEICNKKKNNAEIKALSG